MSYDILFAKGSPSSEMSSVPMGGVSTDTGQGAVFGELGNLSNEVFNIGKEIYTKQGIAEVSQAMFESQESFLEMKKRMTQETDPGKLLEAFSEYKKSIESVKLKNGIAKQKWELAMPSMLNSQAVSVLSDYEQKTEENYKYAMSNIVAQHVQNNTIDDLDVVLEVEVDEGRMNKDEASLVLKSAAKDAKAKAHTDSQQLMSAFAYESPETVLSWKTSKNMISVFPDAKPTDLTWIQGVAQNAISVRNKQKSIRVSQYYGKIHELAAQSIESSTPADILTELNKEEYNELSSQEKTALVKEYNNAVKIWSETGQNLYGNRPTVKYTEMREKILAKQIKDELEIRQWTGKQDGYGLTQEKDLIDLFNNKDSSATAFEDSATVSKVLYPMIEGMKDSITGALSGDKKTFLKEYALRLLEDQIASTEAQSGKAMTEREKREAAIKISLNMKQMLEDGKLEIDPKMLPGAKRSKRSVWKFGLEEIWDKLDAKSRRGAVEALDKGATPEQLIAHYKKKKK